MRANAVVRLLVLLFLALAIGAVLIFVPVGDRLKQFLTWVQDLGFWGPVLLAAIYVPATVFCVPGSLLTLGAGAAFGVVPGTIAVSLGSTAGAAAAFLVGRFLARDWIEQRVAHHPRFHAIDRAVAAQGFKIVLLIRLSPIFPFTILNYAFGLTRVRFRDYVLASWIGMFPGTIMYVYLGSVAGNLASLFAGRSTKTPVEWALYGLGLAATVAVTLYVTVIARRALTAALPSAPAAPVAGQE